MKLLIVNNPIEREINVEHWYKYIKEHVPMEVDIIPDDKIRIDTLDDYDIIFEGASSSYISMHIKHVPRKCKVVKHTLDQWCDMDRWRTLFRNGPPPYDMVISTGNEFNTMDMTNAWPQLRIEHIMLPVDHEVYKLCQTIPKEYDIMHRCTTNYGWPFHVHRIKALEELTLHKEIKVCNTPWTTQEDYINNIYKSKMMYFDHSMRGYFLQKVMDASYCGTPLIGPAPPHGEEYEDIFNGGSYIECKYPFKDLPNLVNCYANKPGLLNRMARTMRENLLKYYRIDNMTKRFNILMERL